MTANDQLTLKTIILHNQPGDSFSIPTYRLLNDLGHDVATSMTSDQVMEMLQHDGADLVVVDADRSEQREFVSRLNDIPDDHQPKQVAIISDAVDDSLTALVHKLHHAASVHELLKPLHMHGLLKMLRNIEAKA
jgi:response regulator of citrate/malate metabolism